MFCECRRRPDTAEGGNGSGESSTGEINSETGLNSELLANITGLLFVPSEMSIVWKARAEEFSTTLQLQIIARGRASSHMLMINGAGTDEQMSNSANGAKTVAEQLEEQQRSVEVLWHGHLHGHQMLRRIFYCLPSTDDIVSWIATGGRSKGTGKIEGPRAEEARVHGQGVWTKRWAILCTPALLFCPTCCGDFDYCFFIGLPGHHCRLVPSVLRSWSFKIELCRSCMCQGSENYHLFEGERSVRKCVHTLSSGAVFIAPKGIFAILIFQQLA